MCLAHGKPMIDYKNLRPLHEILNLKNIYGKFWNDSLGSEIVKHLHYPILASIKVVIKGPSL
jgi:uncharacterized protein (DUF697 family)